MANLTWLASSTGMFAKWSGEVYAKLFSVTPLRSFAAVVCELTNQVCVLVASLLPFKVILLLGSQGTPRYFPDFLLHYDRTDLAVGLSATAVAAFLLHLVCNNILKQLAQKAGDTISHRSEKLILFGGQRELTAKAFADFHIIFAGTVFIVAALSLMAAFYPAGLSMISVFVLACFAGVSIATHRRMTARHWVYSNYGRLLSVLSGIGFLLVFAYIVADFIWLSKPDMLTAIVAIITARQALSRMSAAISLATNLTRQRSRIDVLLFPNAVLTVNKARPTHGYWSLVRKESRAGWIGAAIESVVDAPIEQIKIEWYDTKTAGIAGFDVFVSTPQAEEKFFLKLFSRRQIAQSLQESMLLRAMDGLALPAPKLLTETELDGGRCHVMEGLWDLSPDDFPHTRLAQAELHTSLWQIPPPLELVDKVERSKLAFARQFSNQHIENLALTTRDEREEQQLNELENLLEYLYSEIGNLPRVIANPAFKPNTMRRTVDNRVVGINWGRWALNPVGAGWPAKPVPLDELLEMLRCQPAHSRLANLNLNAVIATVMLAEVLKLHRIERFREAFEFVPDILKALHTSFEGSPPVVASTSS